MSQIKPSTNDSAQQAFRRDYEPDLFRAVGGVSSRSLFRFELLLLFIICVSILVTDFNRVRHHVTGDFQHFFYAADAVLHGRDPYAAGSRGYIYPPLIAFLFQPLAPLGIDRAAGVMLGVNVAVTLLAVALAADEFLRRFGVSRNRVTITGIMLCGIMLNIDKVKGEWQMWQTDVFMLLLFVIALRWESKLPFAAGVVLGIAVNIKYLPLMFLPYFLVRKRWATTTGLVVGTGLFAILPAVSSGWGNNCRNWITATNGLAQMADLRSSPAEAAEVHDVKDSLSCSITSALARATTPGEGFVLAALVAISSLAFCAWIYRRNGFRLFHSRHSDNPTAIGIEWVMMLTALLAFGPQTNTRHLFDALLLTTAASVLLVFTRRGNPPWPLFVGITGMFLGFILPPGSRTVIGERTPTILWLRAGGPCICMLIASFTLLWTGLSNAKPMR